VRQAPDNLGYYTVTILDGHMEQANSGIAFQLFDKTGTFLCHGSQHGFFGIEQFADGGNEFGTETFHFSDFIDDEKLNTRPADVDRGQDTIFEGCDIDSVFTDFERTFEIHMSEDAGAAIEAIEAKTFANIIEANLLGIEACDFGWIEGADDFHYSSCFAAARRACKQDFLNVWRHSHRFQRGLFVFTH